MKAKRYAKRKPRDSRGAFRLSLSDDDPHLKGLSKDLHPPKQVLASVYRAKQNLVMYSYFGLPESEDKAERDRMLVLWEASRSRRVDSNPETIHKAARDNDVEFFKRLGRALKDPLLPETDPQKIPRVARLLVSNWVCVDRIKMGLCFYSIEALCEFCMDKLKRMDDDKGRNRDAMRKQIVRLIKRLGLVKARPARITR